MKCLTCLTKKGMYRYHRGYSRLWWSDIPRETLSVLFRMQTFKYGKKKRLGDSYLNIYYMNTPISFDIEDSSFYDQDNDKVATMYTWQLGFDKVVFRGRTWDEFNDLISCLKSELYRLQDRQNIYRCIIYVHFLDHEFQFIRKMFKWENVFSRKNRSPIYAVTDSIEFRDSYILTGKSLASACNDLRDQAYTKKIGDLNYEKIRGSKTFLTEKENQYCDYDVLSLNEIIREKIEDEGGNIAKIPLTNTGYVRRYVRHMTNLDKGYHSMIMNMTIEPEEYKLLERAFQGGFTHANYNYIGDVVYNVDSIDFTSSYPAVLLEYQYPMSKGQRIDVKSKSQFDYLRNRYCCIFTIKFNNIHQKEDVQDSIISRSRCVNIKGGIFNNGRVYSAEELTTTITNVDYTNIRRFYDISSEQIGLMYVYKKGYLPKPLIQCILDFYKSKTTLKGVKGQEIEYMIKKGMLNSIYGMMVTSIIKPLYVCNQKGEWDTPVIGALEDDLCKYNSNKRRFLFYPWGVFVTAYARQNLYSGLLEFKDDYLYSDTDSIKCINLKKHMDYVNKFNRWATDHIDKCLSFYEINIEESRPVTVKGEQKQLGVWDIETKDDQYIRFKTLGAKRYIYEQSDGLHITIAGISKKLGLEYMKDHDAFKIFKDGMTIDRDHSGKLTHTYLDDEMSGILTDYKGQEMSYHELSSVHLEKSPYEMSLAAEFIEFLKCINMEVIY